VPDLVVAGAGLAGLAAAATAAELGADVDVYEKGFRVGGSMLLSSGVVWRHASFHDFRRECPDGDPVLQRLVYDRLPESLEWLRGLGVKVLEPETANPRTTGMRLDTGSLALTLAGRAGRVHMRAPLLEPPDDDAPVVLATGGFAASRELVREHITPEADDLVLRATPWSTGDGLRLGLVAGGMMSMRMDEFYGRNMPALPRPLAEAEFVPLAQLYAHQAVVEGADGSTYEPRTWSEIDVVQWTARQPGARARYRVSRSALEERSVQGRTIGEMIASAERAGAPVRREGDEVSVEVVAAITTTLGGLAVDARCRVAPGLYAAGGDVGGIANGGYASGLAAALVLGRVAAESALEDR
jgi:succinate dehydrogenase/fumarate reductase flavoprotein subunit